MIAAKRRPRSNDVMSPTTSCTLSRTAGASACSFARARSIMGAERSSPVTSWPARASASRDAAGPAADLEQRAVARGGAIARQKPVSSRSA